MSKLNQFDEQINETADQLADHAVNRFWNQFEGRVQSGLSQKQLQAWLDEPTFWERLGQWFTNLIFPRWDDIQPQQQDEWIEVAAVSPEEWLDFCGLTQYSGYFSNAAIHGKSVYLKTYAQPHKWFQIAGLSVTDEIQIIHQPKLIEVKHE